jgi:hypothetical protein
MPSVTFNLYDKFREGSFDGNAVDFESPGGNGIKCALVTGTYTPDQNAHDFFDDITNEVSGTNYTAGGNVMSNGAVTVDGSGNVTVDLDDPATWTQDASGFSNARRAIIYHDTGTASSSRLIGYSNDFGSDQGNDSGDFSISVNASGLLTSAR